MKRYSDVNSTERPEPITIDEYSVWVRTNINQQGEFWVYDVIQYSKNEYIKLMDEATQRAQADLEYIAMMTEVELE